MDLDKNIVDVIELSKNLCRQSQLLRKRAQFTQDESTELRRLSREIKKHKSGSSKFPVYVQDLLVEKEVQPE